jgi:TPR repeat protein
MMRKFLYTAALFAACTSCVVGDDIMTAARAYTAGNYSTAATLLEPLARAGDPQAQLMLGFLYLHGRGVARNGNTAFAWYQRASQQDLADAQFQLGLMYEIGEGVERDVYEAEYWYGQAVEQGFCPCQLSASGLFRDD